MKMIARLVSLVLATALSVGSLSSAAMAETVTIEAKVVGVAVAEAQGTVEAKATGSSYAFAAAQVQAKAEYRKRGCIWSTGTNSYYANGALQVYFDSVPMKLCPLKHPVTTGGYTWHYIKVDGGRSGTNCGNYANPSKSPPPGVQTLLVLDVRAGTIAKVGVWAKVKVCVAVAVNVTLEWTYKGETHRKERSNSARECDSKKVKDFAKKRITKHTSRKASANAVVRAMARVATKATARAKVRATEKAKTKAVQTVSVVIEIEEEHQQPLIEAGNTVHLVINPNETDPTVPVTVRVKVDPEATASVPSPTVSPASMGYISDWGPTAAPSGAEPGWLYYSGIFHGYPGSSDGTVTLTYTVTDSFGNKATATDTVQITHEGGADV